MLIIHLMSFKWDRKRPFPSVAKLAQKLGLSHGQVRAHIRSLEKRDLIERIERSGRSNEFEFKGLIEALERKLEESFQTAASKGGLEQEDLDQEQEGSDLTNSWESEERPF